jgi:hypothetical protein
MGTSLYVFYARHRPRISGLRECALPKSTLRVGGDFEAADKIGQFPVQFFRLRGATGDVPTPRSARSPPQRDAADLPQDRAPPPRNRSGRFSPCFDVGKPPRRDDLSAKPQIFDVFPAARLFFGVRKAFPAKNGLLGRPRIDDLGPWKGFVRWK